MELAERAIRITKALDQHIAGDRGESEDIGRAERERIIAEQKDNRFRGIRFITENGGNYDDLVQFVREFEIQ